MMIAPEEFGKVLLLAAAWVEERERIAIRDGIPLSEPLKLDARAAGVASVERVRVLKVPQIPMPEHPMLVTLCNATKALSPSTWALSARYGILVRAERSTDREVIVHELVHTSQYERLGGIPPFLQQYLLECLTVGYPQAPMEQEAILTSARICQSET